MIPADSDDVAGQYKILLNELEQYNPELMDKPRVLAITKMDIADAEWEKLLLPMLPDNIPVVFISAVSGYNLPQLKDVLWTTIETFKVHNNEDHEPDQEDIEETEPAD